MIFRRKKYPLPKFPPSIRNTFRMLSVPMSVGEVHANLRPMVSSALSDLHQKSSAGNDFIDIRIANDLAEKALQLIDRYDSIPANLQPQVVGAIRYFADAQDSISEDNFATGLDDDVKIMNHVLELLGDKDGFISSR